MTNVQSLAVTLKVTGVPTVMYPEIGHDMEDGVIITEENQKEYTAPFKREQSECKLDGNEAELMELSANNDGTANLTLVKEFSNESDEKIEEYLNGLSNVMIRDNLNATVYTATVVGVEAYDIM